MAKCQFCGEEVVLPFRCSHCQKYFCIEHKLPEKHQCPDLPEIRLIARRRVTRSLTGGPTLTSVCPKCGSEFIGVLSFDKEKVNYHCSICNNEWVGKRNP